MTTRRPAWPALTLLALALSGCLGGEGGGLVDPSVEPQAGPPLVPPEAGAWDGTTLRMQAAGIGPALVRSVSFTSAADQKCESSFETEGSIEEPWAIGWAVAMGPDRTYFSHDLIREAAFNAEVAGARATAPSDAPQPVSGSSTSTLSVDAGERLSYVFATSYPPLAPGASGGRMALTVHCPEGMEGLETGWSREAHLLSDVSLDGTWASVHVENGARWGAQQAQWSATMPPGPTTFLATAPVAGLATLTSPGGQFTCGPAGDPAAVDGRVLCSHRFEGGDVSLQVTESAPGRYGQSGTSASWMALMAQMESFAWPDPAAP